jgi:hypothetical protein
MMPFFVVGVLPMLEMQVKMWLAFPYNDVHVAGLWSRRWQAFSDDQGHYLILKSCRDKLDTRE